MRSSWSEKTSTMGEIIRGNVTRIMVCRLPAPPTRACSSNRESMLRNAGVSSMTLVDIPLAIRCAHMIPGTLKMLNGPSSTNGRRSSSLLKRPMDGSISMIHESVVASPGIMNDTQNTTSRVLLNGILVRARVQAITVAIGKLITTTSIQTIRVLPRARMRRGSSQATLQLARPHSRSPNQMYSAVLKLRPRMRMIG